MLSVALTIAGSDPSGGAGIQADLKTFHRFGVYGEAVITLLTVQNTCSVGGVKVLDIDLVLAQLEAVLSDIPPQAAKTGALGNQEMVEALAARAKSFPFPLVVDPVMISKQGARLMENDAIESMRRDLLPCSFLIMPNLSEAAALTERSVSTVAEMRDAAFALCDLGAHATLVKGGHLEGDAVDVFVMNGDVHEFVGGRVVTRHTHGTGCTYSAAITAGLAKGDDLFKAIYDAKHFVTRAIASNPGLGSGNGPLNHWA